MFVHSYKFSGMVDAFIHLASQQLSPNPHGVIPVEPRLRVMVHAQSLRVIGQSLEGAGVTTFELEKHGQYYVAWSDSWSETDEWISRYGLTRDVLKAGARESKADCSLCFSRFDVLRLDGQARKNRRNHSSSNMQGSSKLSQLLRTLGDQLDRMEVSAFHISWAPDSVSIVTLPVGEMIVERRMMTADKLQQLCFQRKLRRSSPRMMRR